MPASQPPDSGLATMVNITDEPVVIPIDFGPGHRTHHITVPPRGSAQFDVGYCQPIKGAGRAYRPPIVSMLSMKNGKPRLVPEQAAREQHAWEPPVDAAADRIRELESQVATLQDMGGASRVGHHGKASSKRGKR